MNESATEGAGAPGPPARTPRGRLSLLDVLILQRLADHVREQGIELSASGGLLQQMTMALLEPATGLRPAPLSPPCRTQA